MSRYEKYLGKISFAVGEYSYTVDFTMDDRIALASAYDKEGVARLKELSKFCTDFIMREDPTENRAAVERFLIRNLDTFVIEMMVAAGLAKREDFQKAKEEREGKKD